MACTYRMQKPSLQPIMALPVPEQGLAGRLPFCLLSVLTRVAGLELVSTVGYWYVGLE